MRVFGNSTRVAKVFSIQFAWGMGPSCSARGQQYMIHSLRSLEGRYLGDYIRSIMGVVKGDIPGV